MALSETAASTTPESTPAGTKTDRMSRRRVSGAPASQDQWKLFETIWLDYLDATDRTLVTSREAWLAQNCYTTEVNRLDASGLLSLTVRLVNAASKARLLQAGELFYACSEVDETPLIFSVPD